METLNELQKILSLSVQKDNSKKKKGNTATYAASSSGYTYYSGKIESDNHLLDISSEQGALIQAVHHNDFDIENVTTLVESITGTVSPLILKILSDFSARTKNLLSYTIVDVSGNIIFETKDVTKEIPFYNLPLVELSTLKERTYSLNKIENATIDDLREYAHLGIERNFPTYDSASGYGVSLLSSDGTLYFGGQYSSFERRTNLHAEMAVFVSALMDNTRSFTHLGLMSSKHKSEPCTPCGCCRQFIAELQKKLDLELEIVCFASKKDIRVNYTIDELLPYQWSSKK